MSICMKCYTAEQNLLLGRYLAIQEIFVVTYPTSRVILFILWRIAVNERRKRVITGQFHCLPPFAILHISEIGTMNWAPFALKCCDRARYHISREGASKR